jgi:hypothetical protein
MGHSYPWSVYHDELPQFEAVFTQFELSCRKFVDGSPGLGVSAIAGVRPRQQGA